MYGVSADQTELPDIIFSTCIYLKEVEHYSFQEIGHTLRMPLPFLFEKKKKIMNWGKELLFLNILLQIKVQIGSPGLQDDTFVRVFLTESFWLSLSDWLLLSS